MCGDEGGIDDVANCAMGVASGSRLLITMHPMEDGNKERPTDKQQQQKQANSFC